MRFEAFEKTIWLATPTKRDDELKYIQEAFDTNWITTEGTNLVEIERQVCEKVGCKYAVSLTNGTSALHLAVKLAGVKEGDTVFCTDITFGATVNAIIYEKAKPVFIDTEYDTWNMNPLALEKAFELYPDTKVIMVVNLYGTPAKYDEICSVAEKHGAVIIEDAAESFGATYKGRQTGTFGSYNVISFNGNKIITGSGGGMLLTDDKSAADKARKWSTQSRENAAWYQHEEIGYNYRMSNIVAGVIRGQLPYLEEHIARKKAIYERYKEGLRDLPLSMNPYDPDTMEPNFWLSCILIDKDAMCEQIRGENYTCYKSESGKSCPDEILETLAKYNVQARPIWKPMHMQPVYRMNDFVAIDDEGRGVVTSWDSDNKFDVGADIFQRGLCLPSDIKMTAEEQERIIQIIRSCFE
ncbi:MAG: DegT/DnrJ/EryC1/StrS family aminotransferase [Ruminococcus sp.]|nr:DegT/DnrJ/EryC1/StrS family aminotransferase [Ruminococcus sp.]